MIMRYFFVAAIILAYPSYLLLKAFFRKTKFLWIKLLFPIGYALYKTRLGYVMHLRKLCEVEKRGLPHSITSPINLSVVRILPLAVLEDNYSYLVIDTVTNTAVAVDPCDPKAVLKAAVDNQVFLAAILTTHRHWDHAGGNALIKKHFPNVMVYGGRNEQVSEVTHEVKDKDIIEVGRLSFEALWTPGHTKSHMVYMLRSEPPCAFSGDHIFVCGNGQMFEGTPATMLSSIKKMTLLPKNTLIFPGHEYALRDVGFASQLLPSNTAVQMKWQWVKQQREKRLSTIPSILSEELEYNPFMLTETIQLSDALGMPRNTPPAKVLAELRRQKNIWSKTFV